jgi:hypothetical protein
MKLKIAIIIGILALVNIPLANAATPGAPPSLIEPPSLDLGSDFFGDNNQPPAYQCSDGIDNDADGKTDLEHWQQTIVDAQALQTTVKQIHLLYINVQIQ